MHIATSFFAENVVFSYSWLLFLGNGRKGRGREEGQGEGKEEGRKYLGWGEGSRTISKYLGAVSNNSNNSNNNSEDREKNGAERGKNGSRQRGKSDEDRGKKGAERGSSWTEDGVDRRLLSEQPGAGAFKGLNLKSQVIA